MGQFSQSHLANQERSMICIGSYRWVTAFDVLFPAPRDGGNDVDCFSCTKYCVVTTPFLRSRNDIPWVAMVSEHIR